MVKAFFREDSLHSAIGHIVKDIKSILGFFRFHLFSHTRRLGNFVVHASIRRARLSFPQEVQIELYLFWTEFYSVWAMGYEGQVAKPVYGWPHLRQATKLSDTTQCIQTHKRRSSQQASGEMFFLRNKGGPKVNDTNYLI